MTKKLLFARGVPSLASLRKAPDDTGQSPGLTLAAAPSGPANGTEMLRSLDRLLRHEICPILG